MKAAAGFWGESHGEGHQWEAGSVSALLGLSGEWRRSGKLTSHLTVFKL